MFLTYNVASVKGACTFKERNSALKPPVLKPIRLPVHVMLFATRIKCSLNTPFATILIDVDSRCKQK